MSALAEDLEIAEDDVPRVVLKQILLNLKVMKFAQKDIVQGDRAGSAQCRISPS